MTPEQVARFWAKVDKTGECWVWTKGRQTKGYGQFVNQYHWHLAHRFAWEVTHGPIPEGLQVCHRCDNPPCCNPAHLFLGTIADNMADKIRKGRQPSKITADQVLIIRARYANAPKKRGVGTQLAREFGVTHAQISNIIHRKRWQNI
jgi:hypothetical protein